MALLLGVFLLPASLHLKRRFLHSKHRLPARVSLHLLPQAAKTKVVGLAPEEGVTEGAARKTGQAREKRRERGRSGQPRGERGKGAEQIPCEWAWRGMHAGGICKGGAVRKTGMRRGRRGRGRGASAHGMDSRLVHDACSCGGRQPPHAARKAARLASAPRFVYPLFNCQSCVLGPPLPAGEAAEAIESSAADTAAAARDKAAGAAQGLSETAGSAAERARAAATQYAESAKAKASACSVQERCTSQHSCPSLAPHNMLLTCPRSACRGLSWRARPARLQPPLWRAQRTRPPPPRQLLR